MKKESYIGPTILLIIFFSFMIIGGIALFCAIFWMPDIGEKIIKFFVNYFTQKEHCLWVVRIVILSFVLDMIIESIRG